MTRTGAMWKDIAVFKFEKGGKRFFSSLYALFLHLYPLSDLTEWTCSPLIFFSCSDRSLGQQIYLLIYELSVVLCPHLKGP